MTGPPLLHRTCEHSAKDIMFEGGWVRPNQSSSMDQSVSWWSDLPGDDDTIRAALGLTSHLLSCDRMAYAFEAAEPDLLIRWAGAGRLLFPRSWREVLESAPGAMPAHWWVAVVPVPVRPWQAPS